MNSTIFNSALKPTLEGGFQHAVFGLSFGISVSLFPPEIIFSN